MYKLIFSFIITISTISTAGAAELSCKDKITKIINENGPASDVQYKIDELFSLLQAGTSITNLYEEVVKNYPYDVWTLAFSGSYHSGWFQELAVVNPEGCKFIEFVNVYSE
jgi:hypothetical protein